MWDYPGARLNRQALLELMHLEAEGELVKHFEWWTISLEAAIPRFWVQLNDLTQAYFRQNSETFPDVSSWINWSSHLNAHDRMRFALHSLAIMRPLIGQPPSPLRLLLSFDNSPNSDQHQQQRMDSVEDPCQAGISCRPTRHYQRRRGCPGETCCEAPEVAPQSLWRHHYPKQPLDSPPTTLCGVVRSSAGVLDLSTGINPFPRQKIHQENDQPPGRGLFLRSAFYFGATLGFVLAPHGHCSTKVRPSFLFFFFFLFIDLDLQSREAIEGGSLMSAGDLAHYYPVDAKSTCLVHPTITRNYQEIKRGSYVATTQGRWHILTTYHMGPHIIAMAKELKFTRIDPISELPMVKEDSETCFVDLQGFLYKFSVSPIGGELLVSHEEK